MSPSRPSPLKTRGGRYSIISPSSDGSSRAGCNPAERIEVAPSMWAVISVLFTTVLSWPRVSRKIGVAGRKITAVAIIAAAISLVREAPFTSRWARNPTWSPLASCTESSFKATRPPIPRNRLPLTPVTVPRAMVPAGITVNPPTLTSRTTTKSNGSPGRAWAEETFSASRSLTGVPSGMVTRAGTASISCAEAQGRRSIVSRMYAGILRRCALDKGMPPLQKSGLSPATAKMSSAMVWWMKDNTLA